MGRRKIDNSLFARALRRAADKKKMKHAELARLIDKAEGTVNQIFAGERLTSIPTLIDICDALEITPDYLLSQYLGQPDNMSEDEYHKIMNLLSELTPNELKLVYTMIESIIRYRD